MVVVTRVEYDARAADAPPWYVAIVTGPRRRRRTVRPSRCGRQRKPPSTASVSVVLSVHAREAERLPWLLPPLARGFSSCRSFRSCQTSRRGPRRVATRPGPARPGRGVRDSSRAISRCSRIRERFCLRRSRGSSTTRRTGSLAHRRRRQRAYVRVLRALSPRCARMGIPPCAPFMH